MEAAGGGTNAGRDYAGPLPRCPRELATGRPVPLAWHQEVWLWLARLWGSGDVIDVQIEPLAESFPRKGWGLVLLMLGFVVQAVAGFLK